jgi:hypothetical protein
MIDNSGLAVITRCKLSGSLVNLIIDNSFNLLAQIQLYLISNHIWVRNKDIVVTVNKNNLTFVIVSGVNNLTITVDDNYVYKCNGVIICDKLDNLLDWIFKPDEITKMD